jgi:UDP-N-acetylglucosamine transferase subunit ALG13
MIFVTVGTTDFDALVESVDRLAPKLGLEVVAQIGRGQYEPRNIRWFRTAPSLEPYYRDADVVISHGGLGTVIEVASLGKPLLALSNPDRYDRHQDDLLGYMERQGHLLWCRDLASLEASLQRVRAMESRPYETPPTRVHLVIQEYLDRLPQKPGRA